MQNNFLGPLQAQTNEMGISLHKPHHSRREEN